MPNTANHHAAPQPLEPAMTVTRLCEQMIDRRQLSPATAAAWRAVCRTGVAPFFAKQPLTSLTGQQVQQWLHWLQNDWRYAVRTVRQHAAVLAAATAWAVQEGLLPRDPCLGLRLPPLPNAGRPCPPPPSFVAPPGVAAADGAATPAAHSRHHDVVTDLKAAIRDGAHDLRPLFRSPDLD